MPVIEARDLTVKYGDVTALAEVTLSIQPGALVGITGRAGSGKTTFLHSLGLLVRPSSGDVIIDGIATAALTDGTRAGLRGRRIGLVLRHPNLVPALTVLENVLLPLRYAWIDRAARARARDLLDLVGLGDRAGDRIEALTTAQRQRAAIARALVRMPVLVLADEPTGALADAASDELLRLLREINRMSGVAFVIATHDADVAAHADWTLRLSDGRLVADDAQVDLGRVRHLR